VCGHVLCGILYKMLIQGRGINDEGRGLLQKEGIACGESGVCAAGQLGARGKGLGEVWGRRGKEGESLGFLFPKFPAPVCWAGTQSLPWKFLETGGGMKRSHWWLTDLSPWTPSLSLPSYPLPYRKPALRLFTLSQAFLAFSGRTGILGGTPRCWLPYSHTRNVTYHFSLLHPPVKPFVIPQNSRVTQDRDYFLASLQILSLCCPLCVLSPDSGRGKEKTFQPTGTRH